jgi:hypothetical protein
MVVAVRCVAHENKFHHSIIEGGGFDRFQNNNKYDSQYSNQYILCTNRYVYETTFHSNKNIYITGQEITNIIISKEHNASSAFTDSRRTVSQELLNEDQQTTIFYVLGDAPYSKSQANKLRDHFAVLPDDADFVVHLGDLHSNPDCPKEVYERAVGIFRGSHAPVFVICTYCN